jgi:hypothetical protein
MMITLVDAVFSSAFSFQQSLRPSSPLTLISSNTRLGEKAERISSACGRLAAVSI